MIRHLAGIALAVLLSLPSTQADARRLWMPPCATVLPGEKPWVRVDVSFSGELFQPGFALPLDGLVITALDGTVAEAKNQHRGQKRSSFVTNGAPTPGALLRDDKAGRPDVTRITSLTAAFEVLPRA